MMEGGMFMVTYSDLIQIGLLIISLVNLFYQVYKDIKKK